MRLRSDVGCFTCLFGLAAPAHAAPGSFSVGIERLFGVSRTRTTTDGETLTSGQVSVFAHTAEGRVGYPSPRLALDYLFASGVSAGGAIGYQSIDGGDDNWLLAARVGYFASASSSFGVWPRATFTYVTVDNLYDDWSATALGVEVPLLFRVVSSTYFVGMPYVDLGVAGGSDEFDQTITEYGLQFGVNVFF
jgi:hypothetical protein